MIFLLFLGCAPTDWELLLDLKDYVLTDSEIRTLLFVERPNPRNARYHDMKLYLRKQVSLESHFLFGGGVDKV